MVILEPKIQLQGDFIARQLGFAGVLMNCSNRIRLSYDEDIQLDVVLDHDQCLTVQA